MVARNVAEQTGKIGRSAGFNALGNQKAIMGVVNGLSGRSYSREAGLNLGTKPSPSVFG